MIKLSEVCKFLEENGIGYKILENVNGSGVNFVYLHHGRFGRPEGVKIKKGEFRPDFRISVHEDDPEGKVYTKVCGLTGYMSLSDILETVLGE